MRNNTRSINKLKISLRDVAKKEWPNMEKKLLDDIRNGDEKTKLSWTNYARVSFEHMALKDFESEEERRKLDQKINRLMGKQADRFWLSAFEGYIMFLHDFTVELREMVKASEKGQKETYKIQKEQFEKAHKTLKRLQNKGFLNFKVNWIKNYVDLSPLQIRTKPLTLFVWWMVNSLRNIMTPVQGYRITQSFLTYYLGKELDLLTIKKIYQRNPLGRWAAKIRSASDHS